MTQYHVSWRIDIEADSPTEAAVQALTIQRDRQSTATVFHVTPAGQPTEVIDLQDVDFTDYDAVNADDDGSRCTASSFRGNSKTQPYGPGGFNRCIRRHGHSLHGQGPRLHLDEHGNEFELEPRFRVVRNVNR